MVSTVPIPLARTLQTQTRKTGRTDKAMRPKTIKQAIRQIMVMKLKQACQQGWLKLSLDKRNVILEEWVQSFGVEEDQPLDDIETLSPSFEQMAYMASSWLWGFTVGLKIKQDAVMHFLRQGAPSAN